MISKEFVDLTNSLISRIKETGLEFGNGNVLLAKPMLQEKTSGGIILADDYRTLEQKRAGFAKVIAIPNNLDPQGGDLDIKPGDYVFFTYVADNPIYYNALGNILGVTIPKETVFYTSDAEIIAKASATQVEK